MLTGGKSREKICHLRDKSGTLSYPFKFRKSGTIYPCFGHSAHCRNALVLTNCNGISKEIGKSSACKSRCRLPPRCALPVLMQPLLLNPYMDCEVSKNLACISGRSIDTPQCCPCLTRYKRLGPRKTRAFFSKNWNYDYVIQPNFHACVPRTDSIPVVRTSVRFGGHTV